ncbi:hypothetical protein PybrP1_012833 [[Pythium] brassicae (nom. inval.)]|nr:hypothetical protein PybrP1_012833 [[Pythium] brassicae (nom. inval.)]
MPDVARATRLPPVVLPTTTTATAAAAADGGEEFVCYGDRVCFLCEGQLLALTRKFNLTYQQMALLALLTLATGGTFGVAGLLIWKKGLLRKRYAALFSDAIYADDDVVVADGGAESDLQARSLVTQASGNGTIYGANMRVRAGSKRADDAELSTAETAAGSTASAVGGGGGTAPVGADKSDPRKPITFRIFEYDPATRAINLASVGQPVRFGAPVVVVHAATHRAIRYKLHRGAVTLSKPPKNLHFQRDVQANLPSLQTSSMYRGVVLPKKKPRPQSITTLFAARFRARTLGNGTALTSDDPVVSACDDGAQQQLRHTEVAPRSLPVALDIASAMRGPPVRRTRGRPHSEQTGALRTLNRSETLPPNSFVLSSSGPSTVELAGLNTTSSATTLSAEPQQRASAPAPLPQGRLYRRFSESCVTLAHDISDSITDSLQRQREQREHKKRLKQLLKDLPNMAFGTSSGKYFIATIQSVQHKSGLLHHQQQHHGLSSTCSSSGSGSGSGFDHPFATESFLRWGAPMAIVAEYNGKACGIRPRQYYKDCQLYLTTETSQATLLPLREDGDLQSMAKESTRLLAQLEKRQVTLSVGTYNVWMMPRIVSAFTSVSPKKNTRARLIAEVLPPCDVWVFTECFDHRARALLLDKLKAAGYFYASPTVGHKRLKRENMRKVLNGGVVLASKYPIVTVRIKLFKEACLGADKLADKGVLYCKILKDGLPVHVFATHLQAWSDPASRAMRRTQMRMIADFQRAVGGIDPVNDPVLIVGDLNVNFWLNKTDHEYDEMLTLLNARDPAVVASHTRRATAVAGDASAGGDDDDAASSGHSGELARAGDPKLARQFSFDPRLNALAADGLSTDGSLELLDFVLLSKSHRQPSSAQSWVVPLTTSTPWKWRKLPQFNLSDHYPVVSSFTFDM